MAPQARADASIQSYFLPTPNTSPSKSAPSSSQSATTRGDGFTADEVKQALAPKPEEPWCPPREYADYEIKNLAPGPCPVTFMGRVANIFDVANSPKTPRSAKGCIKLCVKDDSGAITVRLWYASHVPLAKLGSLVSVWTTHISNGEHGALASTSAPLFASLFPERDRSCHFMIHESSDDGTMFARPFGHRTGLPLDSLMTLQSYLDGGCDVTDAKILVVVKSIGMRKRVTRKDESIVENVNVQVHDDTAEATLGLWGTMAGSPFHSEVTNGSSETTHEKNLQTSPWKPGETVLLLQGPTCRVGRGNYLTLNSSSMVDINPSIPDTDWLRRWALRQRSREAVNPPLPTGVFERKYLESGPLRCLYTIAELDEFARAAPSETFQGYLSVVVIESKLHDCWKRQILCSGECCNMAMYANALRTVCNGCGNNVELRLNPRIVGQVIDETAVIASGKLVFSDHAWWELLGCDANTLLTFDAETIKALSDRLLFCRLNFMFGWTGDATKAGGRICILGVQS